MSNQSIPSSMFAVKNLNSLNQTIQKISHQMAPASKLMEQYKTFPNINKHDSVMRTLSQNVGLLKSLKMFDNSKLIQQSYQIGKIAQKFNIGSALKRVEVGATIQALERFNVLNESLIQTAGYQSALIQARESFTAHSAIKAIQSAFKSYSVIDKEWQIPVELSNNIAALKTLHDQIGSITFPVIDMSSAMAVAEQMKEEEMNLFLKAVGIDIDEKESEQLSLDQLTLTNPIGMGLSAALKSPNLSVLLTIFSLFIGFLFYHLQTLSQEETDKKIEKLSTLVERALLQETKRTQIRHVVRNNVTAIVRLQPKHGASVIGKMHPREMTTQYFNKQGKWIEIEFYDWSRKDYVTGWGLKKHFKRVPPPRPVIPSDE